MGVRKSNRRIIVATTKFFIFPVFFIFLCFKITQFFWYTSFIPDHIHVSFPVELHVNDGILGGWGSVVYRLADKTINSINREGIHFLNNPSASQNNNLKAIYQNWKETPVPENWHSNGCWLFSCNDFSRSLSAKIIEASKKPGNYYTTNGNKIFFISVDEKYIVFTYMD
jgi:hypothetical protein